MVDDNEGAPEWPLCLAPSIWFPPGTLHTPPTSGALPGFNSLVLAIASACVGSTALALSDLPFLTA
jgi:hypothetical protein